MQEILTGIIAGIVSGTGMGGGTILILILSIFIGINQHIAQGTNIVFFIPTSIVAIITTIKEKIINWKIGIPIAVSGIIGAVIGATLSVRINVNNLKRYFGFFLILITIYEIYTLFELKNKGKL